MGIIYRAMWDDPTPNDSDAALEHARRAFIDWVTAEGDTKIAGDGAWAYSIGGANAGHRSVTIRSVAVAGATGFRATVSDRPVATEPDNTQWLVTLSVVADSSGVHTLVEEGLETDDPAQRIKLGRPRVVDELLRGPGRHILGSTAVLTEPLEVGADEAGALAAILRSPERTLPYIAFTEPTGTPGRWREIAARTAHRSAGVAVVITLGHAAIRSLRVELGELAVWGGAARTYNLAPLETPEDGWRHRYVTADRLARSGSSVIDGLVYAVAGLSTRRRIPDAFSVFADAAELDAANRVADVEERWAFELELEQEGRQEVERELAAARGHLDRLSRALDERGLSELIWASHDAQPDDIPDEVRDTSEAVLAARTYLAEWLTIPEGVEHELDTLDSTPNSFAWGNTTFRGLRALAAYSQACAAGFTGSFWQWCERGEPLAWPATPKKLSMRESETTANNERFANARTFPVDPVVNTSGLQYMESHLKISEGGGNLAPRVYFHDDTTGPTRKVHIGFIGPHYLVPNTRS